MAARTSDLLACPAEVRRTFGFALGLAQQGGKFVDAKPLKGFGGAGVLEVVEDRQSDTFRCVYSVKFAGAVYVLHTFQKKSKTGGKTPKPDIDLVKERLKQSGRTLPAVEGKPERGNTMKTHEAVRKGGRNIFEDLKLPDAEELNAKAQIAYRIRHPSENASSFCPTQCVRCGPC